MHPEPLTARSGRVKEARKLQKRRERSEHRQFLAEGAKSLSEALGAPGGVVEVFATAAASTEYAALRHAVGGAGLPWHVVADDALASLSGAVTPQGIVAVCRSVDRPAEVLLAAATGTVVICADVRDPGNAGTVIRCADASGASAVVFAGQSVDPYNDKTVRATVGSLWHLPLAVDDGDPGELVLMAQEAGFTVVAADGAGESDLFEVEASGLLGDPDHPVAWLFGNEAWGLPEELASLADHRVSIPIFGRAESLNLATAAAVCLYASARARR